MRLDLPDDIMGRAEANACDLLIALAIQLYSDNRIDYTDAVELSGLACAKLNEELIRRGISIHQYPAIRVRREDSAAA